MKRTVADTRSGLAVAALAVVALAAAFVLVLAPSVAAAEPPPIMHLSEVESRWAAANAASEDLTGTARTVVDGTAVATMDIEVLGVLSSEVPGPQNMILIKTSGAVSDLAGGIAAGMSGSPVYIDDKLVGAISYGAQWSDSTVGLVTPIDEMLRLLAYQPLSITGTQRFELIGGPATVGSSKIDSVVVVADGAQARKIAAQSPGTLVASPKMLVSIPHMDPRSRTYQLITKRAATQGWLPVMGGYMGGGGTPPDMAPGQSLGVNLIGGDMVLTAIGTLTYRDEDKVLGFGHPFSWLGATNLPLVSGYVHTVVKSVAAPFKMASTGAPVGVMTQDRNEGIAGSISETSPPVSPTVDLTMNVVNTDDDTSRASHFRIPKATFEKDDGWLGIMLSEIVSAYGLDRVWNQENGATADLTYTVNASSLATGESLTFTRSNAQFYDHYPGEQVGWGALSVLGLLTGNEREKFAINSVDIEVALSGERDTADILGAQLIGGRLIPGETAEFKFTVLPYGTYDTTALTVPLDIPRTFPVSGAGLTVVPGSWWYGDEERSETEPIRNVVEAMQNDPRGRDLVVTLSSGYGSDGGYDGEMPYYGYYYSSASNSGKDDWARAETRAASSWIQQREIELDTADITFHASAKTVDYRGNVRLYGSMEPSIGGEIIHIYKKTYDDSGYSYLRDTTVNAIGDFRLTTSLTSTSSFYAVYDGDLSTLNARSLTQTVKVRARVSLMLAKALIRSGSAAVLTGRIVPAHTAADKAQIMKFTHSGWKNVGGPLDVTAGVFAWKKWKPPAGSYIIRAVFLGDGSHVRSVSRTRLLSVAR